MSESDKIRLDAATLRWIIEHAKQPSVQVMWLAYLEAEAVSRPPLLSDWVRACETSKLGVPTPGSVDWGWGVYYRDGQDDDPRVALDTERGEASVYWVADGIEQADTVTTPEALTAALDRIAEGT